MTTFARDTGNMLSFPGREPIPRWRVVADYVICPVIGIVLTVVFSSQILEASTPWIYSVIFGIEALISALVGYFNKNPEVRYSGFAIAAYFLFTAVFSLALVFIL